MATTCYAILIGSGLQQVGPPAQVYMAAQYNLVDTVSNTVVSGSNGQLWGLASAVLNCPVASQAAVIQAIQAAIQAQEAATPGLTFVWLGL